MNFWLDLAHIDIGLMLLSVSQKDENSALFPVISIKLECRLAYRPHSHSSFRLHRDIEKRCFESRNNSTFSNPFTDGLLISREISKVFFELLKGFSVTPDSLIAWLLLRSRATYSDLRSFLYLRCFGNITVLYLVFQNYRL